MKTRLICLLLLFTALACPGRSAGQAGQGDYFHNGKSGQPLICGHRGGSDTDLPENSLTLFTALADSFGERSVMIELDVRKSADGELFILHDASLDRTTTGTDSIHRVGSAYLRQLYLTTDDGAATEEKIPTFREVLTWLKGQDKVFLMVDVKSDIWREVTELIREEELTGRCLLLTFSLANTSKVYDLLPDAWISTLVTDAAAYQQLRSLDLPTDHLVAYINQDTPKHVVKQLRRAGVVLTTDVSEQRKGYPSARSRRFYRAFARKHQLGILITDYPVGVKGVF